MSRLPFSPDRLDNNPPKFTLRDWNNTPRIQTDSRNADMVDELAVLMVNQINSEGDRNPLRTFHHNMIFANRLENRDFTELVQLAADMLDLSLRRSRNSRPENNLDDLAYNAVNMHAASVCMDHPELERLMSDQQMREVVSWDRKYQEMNQILADMSREETRGGGYSDNRGNGRRDDWGNNNSRGNGRGRFSSYSDNGGGFARRSNSNNEDAWGRDLDSSRTRNGRSVYIGEFSQTSAAEREQPAQSNNDRPGRGRRTYDERPSSGSNQDYRDGNDVMRRGTENLRQAEQDHQERQFQQQTAKAEKPTRLWEPEHVITGESEMDSMIHASVYSQTDESREAVKKEHGRLSGVAQALTMSQLTGENLVGLIDDHTAEPVLMDNTILNVVSTAVVESMIKSIAKGEEDGTEKRRIYRRTLLVCNSIVGRQPLENLQKLISTSVSMSDLNAKLVAGRGLLRGLASADNPLGSDVLAALDYINQYLTDQFNVYLTSVMGLADPGHQFLTDWIEDFPALSSAIDQNYSSQQTTAYAAFCTAFHRNLNECINTSLKAAERAFELNSVEQDSKDLTVVSVPRSYMATVVPYTSSELGLKSRAPHRLVQAGGSLLYALLINDQKRIEEMTGLSQAQQLFVFRDRVAFEAHRIPNGGGDYVLVPATHKV